MFRILIQEVISQNQELLDSDYINDINKERLKMYYVGINNEVDLQNSLKFIMQCLENHYQKKAILLIDEYDVPLQSAYLNGYYHEMSYFMSNIFSLALKTNDSLERGILTGCLRISKESIFTGFNNFRIYSIFSKDVSSTHFGFTQEEIDDVLNYYHLDKYGDKIKEWYDGYLFGDREIYNPWSVLKYINQIISENDNQPKSYWANTSGNDIVYNYIQNGDGTMKQEFEILIQGKSIKKDILEELTYREMDNPNNIYSFMLFTGYLKIKKQLSSKVYELVIPNKEVYDIFEISFKKYFQDYTKDRKKEFVRTLKENDVLKANKILNDILFNAISFYDDYEAFYHGFLIGLFTGYKLELNKESGMGRFDIAILSNNPFDVNIIIECKKSKERKDLKNDSQKACNQIVEKRYIEGLQIRGYERVKEYGISFFEKSCYISAVKMIQLDNLQNQSNLG